MIQTICRGILFFLVIAFSFSCDTEERKSSFLLSQAKNIIEKEPQKSLYLLDSLPSPQNMKKEDYMQYIVTKTQAKYMSYKGITGDTLILEAQRYFSNKKDYDNSAYANFYTAAYYYEIKKPNKAFSYYLNAEEDARKSENDVLKAKSLHAIGNIYYNDISLKDSALVCYKSALKLYRKIGNYKEYEMLLMNYIGSIYNEKSQDDSTYYYYSKGQEIAIKLNNLSYQALSDKFLGIYHCKNGNYTESKKLLLNALKNTSDEKEKTIIAMNLLVLYTKMENKTEANKYYELLLKRLSDIHYIYTLELAYQALIDYIKFTGNFKEALAYSEKKQQVREDIIKNSENQKLIHIQYLNTVSAWEKEQEQKEKHFYLVCVCASLFILLLGAVLTYRVNKTKSRNKVLNLQNEVLNKRVNHLQFLNNIYENILLQWGKIENKVKELAREYNTDSEPPIFIEIKELMADLREKTNTQLIESTKETFRNLPEADKLLRLFSDDDILLLLLHQKKYSKQQISEILGDRPVKKYLSQINFYLTGKLEKAGLSSQQINKILPKNNNTDGI